MDRRHANRLFRRTFLAPVASASDPEPGKTGAATTQATTGDTGMDTTGAADPVDG